MMSGELHPSTASPPGKINKKYIGLNIKTNNRPQGLHNPLACSGYKG
jgi:hypothetical protein